MCNLGYCPFEDDITISCCDCPHADEWEVDDFDSDEYDEFDEF